MARSWRSVLNSGMNEPQPFQSSEPAMAHPSRLNQTRIEISWNEAAAVAVQIRHRPVETTTGVSWLPFKPDGRCRYMPALGSVTIFISGTEGQAA